MTPGFDLLLQYVVNINSNVVKITALKEHKATKAVKSPRKFGTKKARKKSGGGGQSLMGRRRGGINDINRTS